LFDPARFHDLVSGDSRGLCAALGRGALRVVETPYTAAVNWRNRQYDCGAKSTFHVALPVLSVGNLTLGGTGKTPLVEWLARRCSQQGCQPAIISRGYKARSAPGTSTEAERQPNDEALELAEKLPAIVQIQNPDRVAAARQVVASGQSGTIILDDGFQHRRLARDLDIVLLDALEPFGYEHVFPRGLLREPVAELSRADVIALSRADAITSARKAEIRQRVTDVAPTAVWIETRHAPRALRSRDGSSLPLTALKQIRVAAFCGIGNPAGFRHTLDVCGFQVAAWRELADHSAYPETALARLDAWLRDSDAEAVICTHKDLVKIDRRHIGDRPLYALEIELEIVAGEAAFTAKLDSLLSHRRAA